ncbi:unnamed protein product, partial [Sphacelaria rigidula]
MELLVLLLLLVMFLCLQHGTPAQGAATFEDAESSGATKALSRGIGTEYLVQQSAPNIRKLEGQTKNVAQGLGDHFYQRQRPSQRRRLADQDPKALADATQPDNWLRDSQDENSVSYHSRFAYVTVLLSDGNAVGVRTLGESILDTETYADLVMLLGPAVAADTESKIRERGWAVRRLEVGEGGNEIHQQ